MVLVVVEDDDDDDHDSWGDVCGTKGERVDGGLPPLASLSLRPSACNCMGACWDSQGAVCEDSTAAGSGEGGVVKPLVPQLGLADMPECILRCIYALYELSAVVLVAYCCCRRAAY